MSFISRLSQSHYLQRWLMKHEARGTVTLSWQHATYKLSKLGQTDLIFGL